jgi:hypothetical protein
LRGFLGSVANRFTRQTLPTIKGKHFFMNILCVEAFCPQKEKYTQQTALFSSTVTILTAETSL